MSASPILSVRRDHSNNKRLAVEVDGAIHESQRDLDAQCQPLIEATGVRIGFDPGCLREMIE